MNTALPPPLYQHTHRSPPSLRRKRGMAPGSRPSAMSVLQHLAAKNQSCVRCAPRKAIRGAMRFGMASPPVELRADLDAHTATEQLAAAF